MTVPDKATNLVDHLRQCSARDPGALAFAFLGDGESESGRWSYGRLDEESRAIAALLQEHELGGERALLLLPPGLELVASLWGCLYAGTAAVVSGIPSPKKKAQVDRLMSIVADSRPRAVLTTPELKEMFRAHMAGVPGMEHVRWLTREDVDPSGQWRHPGLGADSLAFLQYTSGSTAAPRGVIVSHGNLIDNAEQITEGMGHSRGKIGVSWLPLHHDMGLVGMVFGMVYAGMGGILMSPLHFIQKPVRWLQAISRYRGHTSGSPNFGFELCVRKVTDEQCEGLDLSCWRVAYNGAEPVRAATLQRFAERFHAYGLRSEALYPCYGLAEATLFVSGPGRDNLPVTGSFDIAALQQGRVVPAPQGEEARTLVSSGRLWGQQVAIVDPETGNKRCPPGQIGEIWVAGPNICQGYWELPEESERTFRARLADEPDAGPFLRTGDLGFMTDGSLFITGRQKDLIIIAGSNHYPQDIEHTVEEGEPKVRPGCSAAISVDIEDEERLVLVAETRDGDDLAATARSIRRLIAEQHDLRAHAVELIVPGSLPKTTSGKIQRHACKAAYLDGSLALWEKAARA